MRFYCTHSFHSSSYIFFGCSMLITYQHECFLLLKSFCVIINARAYTKQEQKDKEFFFHFMSKATEQYFRLICPDVSNSTELHTSIIYELFSSYDNTQF